MNEEYQIDLQEKRALYFKLFRKEYKNYKLFRNRKRLLSAIFITYSLLGCLFNWIDGMHTGVWDIIYFVFLFTILLVGGLIAPCIVKFFPLSDLYEEYWKLRKCLYEENIYIEKIVFSCQGIQILGYNRDKKVSDFVTYQNVNQMSFYKAGIILRPNVEEHIYIPRELFRKRKDLKQIKKWYEEKNRYGETSI